MILGTFVIVFTSQTVSTETQDVLHHHLYGAMEIDWLRKESVLSTQFGVHKHLYTTAPAPKGLPYQPQRRTMDSSLAVLRSQMGTTSSERGRVMLTTDARAEGLHQ